MNNLFQHVELVRRQLFGTHTLGQFPADVYRLVSGFIPLERRNDLFFCMPLLRHVNRLRCFRKEPQLPNYL